MQRQVTAPAAAAAPEHAPAPFRSAPSPHPRRLTLDLSDDDHRAVKDGAYDHRTSMAELLRALVALWREDPEVAARVKARFPGAR